MANSVEKGTLKNTIDDLELHGRLNDRGAPFSVAIERLHNQTTRHHIAWQAQYDLATPSNHQSVLKTTTASGFRRHALIALPTTTALNICPPLAWSTAGSS